REQVLERRVSREAANEILELDRRLACAARGVGRGPDDAEVADVLDLDRVAVRIGERADEVGERGARLDRVRAVRVRERRARRARETARAEHDVRERPDPTERDAAER